MSLVRKLIVSFFLCALLFLGSKSVFAQKSDAAVESAATLGFALF